MIRYTAETAAISTLMTIAAGFMTVWQRISVFIQRFIRVLGISAVYMLTGISENASPSLALPLFTKSIASETAAIAHAAPNTAICAQWHAIHIPVSVLCLQAEKNVITPTARSADRMKRVSSIISAFMLFLLFIAFVLSVYGKA